MYVNKVKRLIQELKNEKNINKDMLEERLEVVYNSIVENTDKYLDTKGVFVVIALIENSSYSDRLAKHLKAYKELIEQRANFKGIQILRDLLN